MAVEPVTLGHIWPVMAIGLLPIGLYILIRTGLFKSWYILKPLPGLLEPAMLYGAPSFGLVFISLSVLAMLPASSIDSAMTRYLCAMILFGLLGFALMIWQPAWIKPKWIRWLEREYGYCLDILRKEALNMGRWNWEVRVRTQADLERWVKEVVASHQKEIDQRLER